MLLGSLRTFLETTSVVSDAIPAPVGNFVKAIANTGIKIMDTLDVRTVLTDIVPPN